MASCEKFWFPPLKTKYNQWKNLCNYPWKINVRPWKWYENYTREIFRENNCKIIRVKNKRQGLPPLPAAPAHIFKKHPWISLNFFVEDPLEDKLKSKSTSRRDRIWLEARRIPTRREPKNHKSEKLKGGSAVCTWNHKYFKVPFEDGGLSKMPTTKIPI